MLTRNQNLARVLLLVTTGVCGLLTAVFAVLALQSAANRPVIAMVSDWMPIALFATLTLSCLIALLCRAHTAKIASLRAAAIGCSLLALLVQVSLWWLLSRTEARQVGIGALILSATDADTYLEDNLPPGRDPMRVRTGVFMQSFNFIEANTVEVTGYIWQRYPADTPDDLVRGFVLPEASGAYEATEAYRARDSRTREETIGWHFSVRLRQAYSYEKYPFDHQVIRLRMWHKDFNRGAILVPDFDAYGDMRPNLLPGVESDFVREGWENKYACYTYNRIRYNSNFGFGTFRDRPPLPELYFNVGIKRTPGSIFLRRVLPLMVVTLLLFVSVLLVTRESRWRELTGNDAFAFLAFCSVLCIALAADHIHLRGALAANTFIYAESGYLCLYLLLVLLAAGVFLLSARRPVALIEYEDGAALTLLFWPVLLGLILLTTVLTFIR